MIYAYTLNAGHTTPAPLSVGHIPRDVDHCDPVLALQQEHGPERGGAMVMQQLQVPVALYQLWNEHRNLPPGIALFQIEHVVHDRPDHKSVGRFKNNQTRYRDPALTRRLLYELAPLVRKRVGVVFGKGLGLWGEGGDGKSGLWKGTSSAVPLGSQEIRL